MTKAQKETLRKKLTICQFGWRCYTCYAKPETCNTVIKKKMK